MKRIIALVLIVCLIIIHFCSCLVKQKNNSLVVYFYSSTPDAGFVKKAITELEQNMGVSISI